MAALRPQHPREVLRIGLSSRRSALTALRDISARPDVVKGTRVQAADGWLERHFNTGDRPNGRIYYCYRGERCSVLVSFLFRSRLTRPPTSSIFRRCDPSWNAAAQTRSPNNSVQRPGIALLAQAVARAFGTQPIRLT
jgi:hypothetical protein